MLLVVHLTHKSLWRGKPQSFLIRIFWVAEIIPRWKRQRSFIYITVTMLRKLTSLDILFCLTNSLVVKEPPKQRNFHFASCSTSISCLPLLSSSKTFLLLTACVTSFWISLVFRKCWSYWAQSWYLPSHTYFRFMQSNSMREVPPSNKIHLDISEDLSVVGLSKEVIQLIRGQVDLGLQANLQTSRIECLKHHLQDFGSSGGNGKVCAWQCISIVRSAHFRMLYRSCDAFLLTLQVHPSGCVTSSLVSASFQDSTVGYFPSFLSCSCSSSIRKAQCEWCLWRGIPERSPGVRYLQLWSLAMPR